jgi:succinylarginine dihydrolase
MKALEANFDGLIGPTHNYAGLAYGNLASAANQAMPANPREAALQGLAKMKRLADLGLVQGVLPPHARPHLSTLRALGFHGSDKKVLAAAAKTAPELLKNVYAAAAMWTANAATVSPSADSADGKVHFTPANLAANFHRAIEARTTARVLKAIFRSGKHFTHHAALPGGVHIGDEGAANHCRFCSDYGEKGLQLFVYGRSAFGPGKAPEKYPGRQTREASEAVARLHKLDPARVHFVQQNPKAIDAGVFHNDVVAVSNKNVFFYHQEAYENPSELIGRLQQKAKDIPFHFIEMPSNLVTLADAVKSYLFNSQLLSVPGRKGLTLLAPMEAGEIPSTAAYLKGLVKMNEVQPISDIEFIDVRQSMRNGGGPACLRLRVVLTEVEKNALTGQVLLTDDLYKRLAAWVSKHYRDRVEPKDLADPELMEESFSALDSLTKILGLGPIYEFQL